MAPSHRPAPAEGHHGTVISLTLIPGYLAQEGMARKANGCTGTRVGQKVIHLAF